MSLGKSHPWPSLKPHSISESARGSSKVQHSQPSSILERNGPDFMQTTGLQDPPRDVPELGEEKEARTIRTFTKANPPEARDSPAPTTCRFAVGRKYSGPEAEDFGRPDPYARRVARSQWDASVVLLIHLSNEKSSMIPKRSKVTSS